MPECFADRLTAAILAKDAPACVGIDPVLERLPAELLTQRGAGDRSNLEASVAAVTQFCRQVIECVSDHVPAVKINSAFFERFYWQGVRAYYELVEHALEHGLIVIGDIKRGDIGHSSSFYAHAHLADSPFEDCPGLAVPDAVTLSPFLGSDAIAPFLDVAREQGRGVFVLVQTSNESGAELQGLTAQDGRTVAEHVARLVDGWADDAALTGSCGYSSVGVVVSPREGTSTQRLRELMPRSIFLVPGFGAQGKTAGQVKACFKPDGSGALVTSSRGILYAFNQPRYRDQFGTNWKKSIEQASRDFVAELRSVVMSGA